MFTALLGIGAVFLAPVMPLVLLGGVCIWIGANRAFDYFTRGKRK